MTKKILLSLALAAGALTMAAQDNPNRVLVHNNAGGYTPYIIDNVDKLTFATVEGEVACDVKIKSFDENMITITATRTEACQSFSLGVFPGVIARSFINSPEATKGYMDQAGAQRYYEDFDNGQITGVELTSGTEWAVVTQGYDSYGTPCQARAAFFVTPDAELVGNPKVTATVTGNSETTISLHFVANEDVLQYSYVIFPKGEFEKQYEMFAPMFGFTNPGQMIQMWGSKHDGNTTEDYTYENLEPNTDYELYIQATDINGAFAPMEMVECSTVKVGGTGEAKVAINIGEYKLNLWEEEMKPSQFVTYTPNDQVWRYRFGVYLAETYDANPEAIKDYIQSEPEMPTANWWFYEELTTDYQLNPSTSCVAVASAQNSDGTWGPLTEVRFTTPDKVEGKPGARKGTDCVRSRVVKKANVNSVGRVPVINRPVLTK